MNGENRPLITMNWLSLRNNRFKIQDLPEITDPEYSSIQLTKTERCHDVTSWSWKHLGPLLHLEAGPIHCVRGLKSSLVIGSNPLHLEAMPICCVRGLKSSVAIGQKAQIGPNPFTLRGRADLVV
jgi:hypothetical protein